MKSAVLGLVLLAGCAIHIDPSSGGTGQLTFIDGPEDDAGTVDVEALSSALFGLPSNLCVSTQKCITNKISTLNVNGGSDLPNSPSRAALAGALYLHFQGTGNFWCEQNLPQGTARCNQDADFNASQFGALSNTRWENSIYKNADIEMAHQGGIPRFSWVARWVPDSWAFSYPSVCKGHRPPYVQYFGRHSSSDDMKICWGG